MPGGEAAAAHPANAGAEEDVSGDGTVQGDEEGHRGPGSCTYLSALFKKQVVLLKTEGSLLCLLRAGVR